MKITRCDRCGKDFVEATAGIPNYQRTMSRWNISHDLGLFVNKYDLCTECGKDFDNVFKTWLAEGGQNEKDISCGSDAEQG